MLAVRKSYDSFDEITMLDWYQQRKDIFPLLATLCAMSIYTAPIVMGVRLAYEPSVVYWGGPLALTLFVIPVIIAGAHLFYLCKGGLALGAVGCTLMAPAVLLIVLGFAHTVLFNSTISTLNSDDCSTSSDKALLEEAWESAASKYDSCLQRVANTTMESVSDVAAVVHFDDCEEYTDSSASDKYHDQWYYLKRLEHVELCAGWCTPGSKPLFMDDDVPRDICSNSAAQSLEGYVRRIAWQLVVFGVIAAVGAAGLIHYCRPHHKLPLSESRSLSAA